jgi:(p)ppGpp synthase/HD superfamily hydrolase
MNIQLTPKSLDVQTFTAIDGPSLHASRPVEELRINAQRAGFAIHDAAEDQGGEATLAEIEARFGQQVAKIVADCSDTFETPKPPWRERKERYIAHLDEASQDAI